jgi:hypothetical protein
MLIRIDLRSTSNVITIIRELEVKVVIRFEVFS